MREWGKDIERARKGDGVGVSLSLYICFILLHEIPSSVCIDNGLYVDT